MSIPLIAIVTAIYFGVAWSEYRAGRHGMAMGTRQHRNDLEHNAADNEGGVA